MSSIFYKKTQTGPNSIMLLDIAGFELAYLWGLNPAYGHNRCTQKS